MTIYVMFKSKTIPTDNNKELDLIFSQYYCALCFFANKLLNNYNDAEDVVENTFLKLWIKNYCFHEENNIKALLYLTVKNECTDFLRKKRREELHTKGLSFYLQQETEENILHEIVRSEVLRELYHELQQLPAERRHVMELLFIKGWDSLHVAQHLGISIHTVKKHKLNSIRHLRSKLGVSHLGLLVFLSHI